MNQIEYVESDDPNSPIRCDHCGTIFANDREHIQHLSAGFAPFLNYLENKEEQQ